ncbi:DNA polymerase epsilon subunit 4 [Culex quinquefasciatus]|uniref:DNA polymerase epsilon subunit 4 n=1 Tax=Culex quinquefasciatus TaxID=7176 RepID=UPI0018E3E661|nr:DNA polymerase epsilon subunit 4 [Culex quinquefasciatus]
MESEGTTSGNQPETIVENPVIPESEEIDFGDDTFPVQTVTEQEKESDEIQPDQGETEAEGENDVETEEAPEEELIEDTELEADSAEQPDDQPTKEATSARKEPAEPRLVQLPLSKIKQIMKLDPDVNIVSAEAIFLVTRAAELFVQNLAKEAYTHTAAGKKKTIAKRDVDMTIESVDTLMFLEGMMNV